MSQFTKVRVYFCPDDQPAEKALAKTDVYIRAVDTFEELQEDIQRLFCAEAGTMHFVDSGDAVYPLTHQVLREVREDGVIRLVKIQKYEENDHVTDADDQFSLSEDGGDPHHGKLHRKPLLKELVIHCIYTALILMTTYGLVDTTWVLIIHSTPYLPAILHFSTWSVCMLTLAMLAELPTGLAGAKRPG